MKTRVVNVRTCQLISRSFAHISVKDLPCLSNVIEDEIMPFQEIDNSYGYKMGTVHFLRHN